MEQGKIGERRAKAILKKDVLRDVNYLLSKGLITNNEVYYLVKNFLKKYMGLEYEFTQEELFKELKNIYLPYNIRADFFKFIEKIFMFEYSMVTYSDGELRVFMKEFKSYLDYLLTEVSESQTKGGEIIFRRWKKQIASYIKKFKISKHKVSVNDDEPEPLQLSLKVLDSVRASHVDINSLLEKIYFSLYNSDIDSAAALYEEVISLYNNLPPEEKISYYEVLNSVYDSIINE